MFDPDDPFFWPGSYEILTREPDVLRRFGFGSDEYRGLAQEYACALDAERGMHICWDPDFEVFVQAMDAKRRFKLCLGRSLVPPGMDDEIERDQDRLCEALDEADKSGGLFPAYQWGPGWFNVRVENGRCEHNAWGDWEEFAFVGSYFWVLGIWDPPR